VKVIAVILVLLSSSASAVITLTEITSPTFGLILSGASGRNFVLNTDSSISGTSAADQITGQAAGDITVMDDTAPVTLVILVDNIIPSAGLTVNQVLCSYNGGAQTQCDVAMNVTSSASASLKVGIDITTSIIHSGGEAENVSMVINITYL
jgi:hypothetical protein